MAEKEQDVNQVEALDSVNRNEVERPDQSEARVTFKVWIVVTILSWGYGLSFIPVPAMAQIGTKVATDLGDPTASNWFIASWIISITIMFMLAGANTDLLGRRWFLITGQAICFIGHLVTGTAKSNAQVIAGMSIDGIGAALCQMAAFALPELLPNRLRHIGVVLADIAVFATIIIIPVTAIYSINAGNWRANFYAAAALQALSAIGLFALYHPPKHPTGIPFLKAFREADYIGMFLFVAGSLPVLVGIVYTATVSSSDPRVIATLVVGFVFLAAFAVWETWGFAKHPLTPPIVFKRSYGRDFTAPAIVLAIINMFYYSSSIIWPTAIAYFYTEGGQPWTKAAALSLAQGCAITAGAIGLSAFGSKIRRWHHQQTVAVTVMVVFGALLALYTPDNFGLMLAFNILSLFGYGWCIYLAITFTQCGVPQEQLGISGGLSGCVRFAGGSIAQAIYLTVFQNDVAKKTPLYVARAAQQSGVSQNDVTQILQLLATPTQLAANYSPEVVSAVFYAQKLAIAHGIKLIALTSLGFGIIGIIACLCCKDIDHRMNNTIEVFLENDEFAEMNKYH